VAGNAGHLPRAPLCAIVRAGFERDGGYRVIFTSSTQVPSSWTSGSLVKRNRTWIGPAGASNATFSAVNAG
jgi:hypothetical protein